MAVSIEDILLARAQRDEANQIGAGPMALLGASLGATAGYRATAPSELDKLDAQIKSLNQKKPKKGKKAKQQQRMSGKSRAGKRMAGGLVGAILGGGLGIGARQAMVQNSPAAEMLAKLQVGGELTYSEERALQDMLADSYAKSSTLAM